MLVGLVERPMGVELVNARLIGGAVCHVLEHAPDLFLRCLRLGWRLILANDHRCAFTFHSCFLHPNNSLTLSSNFLRFALRSASACSCTFARRMYGPRGFAITS